MDMWHRGGRSRLGEGIDVDEVDDIHPWNHKSEDALDVEIIFNRLYSFSTCAC